MRKSITISIVFTSFFFLGVSCSGSIKYKCLRYEQVPEKRLSGEEAVIEIVDLDPVITRPFSKLVIAPFEDRTKGQVASPAVVFEIENWLKNKPEAVQRYGVVSHDELNSELPNFYNRNFKINDVEKLRSKMAVNYVITGIVHDQFFTIQIIDTASGEIFWTNLQNYIPDSPRKQGDLAIGIDNSLKNLIPRRTEKVVGKKPKYETVYRNGACQEQVAQESMCFIATAAFGEGEVVDSYRRYRDNVLEETSSGKQMVRLYYVYAPSIAESIKHNEKLRGQVRHALLVLLKSLLSPPSRLEKQCSEQDNKNNLISLLHRTAELLKDTKSTEVLITYILHWFNHNACGNAATLQLLVSDLIDHQVCIAINANIKEMNIILNKSHDENYLNCD